MKAYALLTAVLGILIYVEYSSQQNYRRTVRKYYECTNLTSYHRLKPITATQYKRIFSKHSTQLVCREAYYTKEYVDLLKSH